MSILLFHLRNALHSLRGLLALDLLFPAALPACLFSASHAVRVQPSLIRRSE